MPEYKKIILTTDLSPSADAATPHALELARRYGGTLYLVHVLVDPVYFATAPGGEPIMATLPQGWLEKTHEDHSRRLKEKADELSAKENVTVLPVLRFGHAAGEILAVAKEENADCIVIATHGRTGIAHFLFGSTTERVVRASTCPVLTVRPTEPLKA